MSGTLQASVVKDEASATNNLTLNTSGGVTVGQNLTVTGTSTFTGSLGNVTTGTISSGNITSSGTVADATGTLRPLVSGTAVASTSGTSVTFTGIPSWVKRITIMMSGVSVGTISSVYQVQIGSGSVTTTGYASQNWTTSGGSGVLTSGFAFGASGGVNTYTVSGVMVLNLIGSNTWVGSHAINFVNVSSGGYSGSGNSPALSGALDRVVITTVGGATFTGGTINILYE